MALIDLKDVKLRFPVFNSHSRSLRLQLFEVLGGELSTHNKSVQVNALNGINLKLRDGNRLGLVGHNGAGKTTLLRVLSRIYPPSEGTVKIQGSISSLTNISMGMDPEATGLENIIFRLVFLGMTFKEAKAKVTEIAEFSGLGEFINLPLRTYSSGMALRLAFAASTSVTPDILILDEMIGAGDAAFQAKAKERIDKTLSETKILVLASHDLGLLNLYCDQGIWLEKGHIKGQGPIAEVIEQYQHSLISPQAL